MRVKACCRAGEKTAELFPNMLHLLGIIPEPSELTLAKLGKGGFVSTDNCNTAQKFCKLLIGLIEQTCADQGYSHEEVKVFEGDC